MEKNVFFASPTISKTVDNTFFRLDPEVYSLYGIRDRKKKGRATKDFENQQGYSVLCEHIAIGHYT